MAGVASTGWFAIAYGVCLRVRRLRVAVGAGDQRDELPGNSGSLSDLLRPFPSITVKSVDDPELLTEAREECSCSEWYIESNIHA